MSLRAFHFFFITISILLSAGLAYLGLSSYQVSRDTSSLVFGAGASLAGFILLAYGIWFIRKSRKLII